MCLWSVWGVCTDIRGGVRPPGARTTGSCELPDVGAGNRTPLALQLGLTMNYVHELQVQTHTLLPQSPQSQGLQVRCS